MKLKYNINDIGIYFTVREDGSLAIVQEDGSLILLEKDDIAVVYGALQELIDKMKGF